MREKSTFEVKYNRKARKAESMKEGQKVLDNCEGMTTIEIWKRGRE